MSSNQPGYRKHMTHEELLTSSRSKFRSAKKLLSSSTDENSYREDGVYLAGYAIELIIKRHIALSLSWNEYPPEWPNRKELDEKRIEQYDKENRSFYTHDLNKLLIMAGLYKEVMSDSDLLSHWQLAQKWKVESRYENPGDLQQGNAQEILDSMLHMIKWIMSKHE